MFFSYCLTSASLATLTIGFKAVDNLTSLAFLAATLIIPSSTPLAVSTTTLSLMFNESLS